jgi:ATP phosphoribosyltransferase
MNDLRIGLPSKGRLQESAIDLLSAAGLTFRRQDRILFARVREIPAEIIFLRADDIPVLVAEGALDVGITGSDLVAESEVEVSTRLELGVGRCRLALCTPIGTFHGNPAELDGKRVATSFPRTTQRFLREHGAEVHLVHLSGSVEITVRLGAADAIVDLVETGSTLAANNLEIAAEIGSYQSVLIQNPNSAHQETIERIARRLEGVIIARSWSLLEYNIPRLHLGEAERMTPGYKSPTVNPLEDPEWCAVRAMVRTGDVHTTMEQLEKLGATAILETKISNCRL